MAIWLLLTWLTGLAVAQCPDYSLYSMQRHEPYSEGRFNLSYQRPESRCRKARIPEVEEVIEAMKKTVQDPDLFRLFENAFPNTVDTAIAWHGRSNDSRAEELTFITTGDIPAMWIRDSANQLASYKALLRADDPSAQSSTTAPSLAALFRGAINLQARYLQTAPYCNAFRPPAEGLAALFPQGRPNASDVPLSEDFVFPPVPRGSLVHECKFELDSLAAFLQLSWDYFSRTRDAAFFTRGSSWAGAVAAVLGAADALRGGTYDGAAREGTVPAAPYQFQRLAASASETLLNGGAGAPARGGTGMVRSAFRPSDDACTYPLLVPANMMLAGALGRCAEIMDGLDAALAARMREAARAARDGVERHGRVGHRLFGKIYAYEVDGYGSHNIMDDANIPSLLSAPLLGYINSSDPVYQNTRRFVLSRENPYFMAGPVMNATGSPHNGPGMAWPMSLIVRIMTSEDDVEIIDSLRQLLSSTDGLGLIHESISSWNSNYWTRQWFSWANGLFGQMLLDIRERKPHLLTLSYQ